MEKITYSITELEELTQINRRTIHYYIQQKLIPPPEGKGGSAKYGKVHYYRLLLIKHMQKSHLRLSGIKEALDSMSREELKKMVSSINNSNMDWDTDSLGKWMNINEPKEITDFSKSSHSKNVNMSFLKKPQKKQKSYAGSFFGKVKRKFDYQESLWERFVISDGIEIHIRNDIMKANESVLKDWIDYLKNLANKFL